MYSKFLEALVLKVCIILLRTVSDSRESTKKSLRCYKTEEGLQWAELSLFSGIERR